ncbi:hypothetical protein E4U43_008727 [Claviceps pusilla]|uniref:Store-operated calcium entry-associated regulatory factor n=1 Tax=Claviceps pusilla TaxID=123648 RepID=A0A9P7NCN3_9HYPO|nr:hypothetical protein E4U43_008727 [Claviceps pusilla]
MHTNILSLLLIFTPLTEATTRPRNAILLSQVETLTLRGHGAKTTHRRVSPIPQLKCVSSKEICNLYDVEVMRCTNQGSSYGDEDIQWSCSASLPEELKLGSTEVICEGYASADDPYVLKGSCGVEYSLLLTSKGEARYPHIANPHGGYFSDGHGGIDGSAVLFLVIFVGVLIWILSSACKAAGDPGRQGRRTGGRRGGGGGGGGGGDDGGGGDGPGGFGGGGWGWGSRDDPPPPYPGTKPPSSQSQSWYPGFWSGLAGGATAGYLAGRRGRNNNGRAYDSYGSGWAGPSNTWGSEPSYPRLSPRPSPAFSAPISPSNSSQHESTGFGSTRRR